MNELKNRIDTHAGITTTLGSGESLAGFTALVAERRRWVQEHPNEPLSAWYVLGGSIYLDKFGQVHTVTFGAAMPWVQRGDDELKTEITWSSRAVPRDIDYCLHCGGPITARELKTIFVGSFDMEANRLEVWHGECRILWLDEQRRDAFSVAFKKAELALPTFYSMPSHYHETKWTGPWYRAESPELGSLLIGWRKRVINLSWEQSGARLANVDGEKLFANEDVTKASKMIHAWSYDKLTEYLVALKRAVR